MSCQLTRPLHVSRWGNPSSPPGPAPTYLHLVKQLATKRGNIKISGVVFGDTALTAGIEATTVKALRKQYDVAGSARATGFQMQLHCVGTNKSSTTRRRLGAPGLRCSLLVRYASDQPPHRHCFAAKAEVVTFLGVTPYSLTRLLQQSQSMVRLNY